MMKLAATNGKKKIYPRIQVQAARVITDQNLGMRQAAQDLDIHESVLRKWVKDYSSTPAHAFPGLGHQKPEQVEVMS